MERCECDGIFFKFPNFVKIRVDTTEKNILFGYFEDDNNESENSDLVNDFMTSLQKEGFCFSIRNSRSKEDSKFYACDAILNSPFFRRKTTNFVCRLGAKYYRTSKDKSNPEDPPIDKKKRIHAQPTRKMNCKAYMRIEEIVYYPDYRIMKENWRVKKEVIERLKRDLGGNNKYSVPFRKRFYVWISLPCVHNHSKISSFFNQPLDAKLKNQINFLVCKGITDVKLIKENLEKLSAVEFPDAPETSRAFYPDKRTVYNYILKYKELMKSGSNVPVIGFEIDEINCTRDAEASIAIDEEYLNQNVVEVEIPFMEVLESNDEEEPTASINKELIAKIRIELTRLLNLSYMISDKSNNSDLKSVLQMIKNTRRLLDQNIPKENCFNVTQQDVESVIINKEENISLENCFSILPSEKERKVVDREENISKENCFNVSSERKQRSRKRNLGSPVKKKRKL